MESIDWIEQLRATWQGDPAGSCCSCCCSCRVHSTPEEKIDHETNECQVDADGPFSISLIASHLVSSLVAMATASCYSKPPLHQNYQSTSINAVTWLQQSWTVPSPLPLSSKASWARLSTLAERIPSPIFFFFSENKTKSNKEIKANWIRLARNQPEKRLNKAVRRRGSPYRDRFVIRLCHRPNNVPTTNQIQSEPKNKKM